MSNAVDEGDRTSEYGSHTEIGESNDRTDADRLDERLRAVERALTGSDAAVADLGDGAAAAAEREALESRVADLESRVEELEAATQAIRGYVGSIRAVNREVERRADLALARASRGEDAARGVELPSEDDPSDENRDGDAPADAVPSETALDAAVPTEGDRRTGAPGAADWDSAAAGDDTDGSWRDEAMARLRESL